MAPRKTKKGQAAHPRAALQKKWPHKEAMQWKQRYPYRVTRTRSQQAG
jgi:hypothetical protein